MLNNQEITKMFQLSEYKVAFKHDRLDLSELPDNNNAEQYNGATLCMIFNIETGDMLSFGWQVCQKRGCFNKNKQRKEAMTHALANFECEIRTEFWHMYFKTHGKVD